MLMRRVLDSSCGMLECSCRLVSGTAVEYVQFALTAMAAEPAVHGTVLQEHRSQHGGVSRTVPPI